MQLPNLASLPKWVVPIAAGTGIGVVVLIIRKRNAQTVAVSPDGQSASVDPLAGGSTGSAPDQISFQPSPLAVVQPVTPPSEPAETVGAVAQTALVTLGGFFDRGFDEMGELVRGNTQMLTSFYSDQTQLEGTRITQSNESFRSLIEKLNIGGGAPNNTVLQAQPAVGAGFSLPAGFTPGDSVRGRRFPGVAGFRLITPPTASGGGQYEQWRLIYTTGQAQDWSYWIKGNTSKSRTTGQWVVAGG